ncbi:MAG: bifunctional demethylmenaquinone methyltransferase/2-methoxy-6-polyprenyl-1,4-benzoquinol methylase UbiE [Armatimonadetes bacterium]|nr:bifunctional demethylmenaquinone methyltransferase/2-methoxy-6-polyprenyl-1,4-benzoquinol methylase UbiE [Armatimonadota bacterium]
MATAEAKQNNGVLPGEGVLPAPDDKHRYVREMFDAIAPTYDRLNSVLSGPLHHYWRRVATAQAALKPGNRALDVCTGTGDFALELAKVVGETGHIDATDFSAPMLQIGEQKARNKNRANTAWAIADTQELPFADNGFDAVTVGFGIRNVSDVPRGIREMARVAKPGGRVVILEFGQPTNKTFDRVYRWYSKHVMPRIGGLVSGRKSAYEYLPESVAAFYTREQIAAFMREAGLSNVSVTNLTFGTVVIHCGTKSAPDVLQNEVLESEATS